MQSGTKIQLQKGSEAAPGATERKVTISGDAQHIAYAEQLIQVKVQESQNGAMMAMTGGGIAGKQSREKTWGFSQAHEDFW